MNRPLLAWARSVSASDLHFSIVIRFQNLPRFQHNNIMSFLKYILLAIAMFLCVACPTSGNLGGLYSIPGNGEPIHGGDIYGLVAFCETESTSADIYTYIQFLDDEHHVQLVRVTRDGWDHVQPFKVNRTLASELRYEASGFTLEIELSETLVRDGSITFTLNGDSTSTEVHCEFLD